MGWERWLPVVHECALADIFCAETYLPLCLAVELPYWSPVLDSSRAELEVLPFGLDTSASESLTASPPSSWPGNPIPPPNVGFPFPHKLTLNQNPCHRETERLRKVSFRNFLSSLSRWLYPIALRGLRAASSLGPQYLTTCRVPLKAISSWT